MARAVFDPNVLVSALISPHGAPATLYLALTRGRFELVASPQLLAELERVLGRAKFRRYASLEQARAFVAAVGRLAVLVEDPPPSEWADRRPRRRLRCRARPRRRRRGDRLGDRYLLGLSEPQPTVFAPREFLERLE